MDEELKKTLEEGKELSDEALKDVAGGEFSFPPAPGWDTSPPEPEPIPEPPLNPGPPNPLIWHP